MPVFVLSKVHSIFIILILNVIKIEWNLALAQILLNQRFKCSRCRACGKMVREPERTLMNDAAK